MTRSRQQIEIFAPMCITSRLMAGIRVGEVEISVTPTARRDQYGKTLWHWYIDGDVLEASGDDLAGWGGHREILGGLLSFLSACGEGLAYQDCTGRESENADLFARDVAEWARDNNDELSLLSYELEEESNLEDTLS